LQQQPGRSTIFSQVTAKRQARHFGVKTAFLLGLTIVAVAVVMSTPPRSDQPSYFAFADQRTFLGIPHFMDVISNAPWAVIGIAGLLFAWRRRVGPDGTFTEAWEQRASVVLFAAVLGVSVGSSYFHHAPGVQTLVWDRLPMAIAFMSVFALIIGDRIDLRVGRALLWPLVALGVFSVLYWWHTETLGKGDFRWYILVQALPMLAIPVMLVLFPARYTRARDIWLGLGWYGVAKLFELYDAPVFALTKVISGHTLKHLTAGVATLLLLRVIRLRRTSSILNYQHRD
jgi:hypothetical protein